jgi:hypothetical protein
MGAVGAAGVFGSLVFSISLCSSLSKLSSLKDDLKQFPQHPDVVLLLKHPFAPHVTVCQKTKGEGSSM